jgi:hypothetical protein
MLFVPVAVLLCASLLTACNFTVTLPKEPIFAISMDSVTQPLNQLVNCQHFEFKGREVSNNGKKTAQFELDVINGKDIPEDYAMKVLAKKLGSVIKKALKDTSEFQQYRIVFMQVTGNSISSQTVSTGITFDSKYL